MSNEEFVKQNKDNDIRSLALKKMPEGVDSLWCLQQIEGYQLAKKKLPHWATTEGLWFPPRISMEQCSSEATALYKKQIISRLVEKTNKKHGDYSITDITGGFGVDFSYMADGAKYSVYIERQEVLCNTARHNISLLGIQNATVLNIDAETAIKQMECQSDVESCEVRFVFADPARRDDSGNKTVAIEDCTPDICKLQDSILDNADFLIIKLSPMLDITQALRQLHNVIEVHVVSVKGECKELLFVLSSSFALDGQDITYHCVNLETKEEDFICNNSAIQSSKESLSYSIPQIGKMLLEPNASILKAGVQEAFAEHYGLQKLHPHSNLYISDVDNLQKSVAQKNDNEIIIPARKFVITGLYDFSKASIKQLQSATKQANITIRNFPSTVAELRKRLKIKEGGSNYLFATTLKDDSHVIIMCKK